MKLLASKLALALCALVTSATASAWDTTPCDGCTGQIVLGTTVSVPGVTVQIGYGSNPPNGDPQRPNGSCHLISGICIQKTQCTFNVRYTFAVPQGNTYTLTTCVWDSVNSEWDCIIVSSNFTSSDNGSHDEMAGSLNCGVSADLEKVELAGASQAYQLVCNACIN